MTAPSVRIRAAARRDLAEHYRYLLSEAGLKVAERFLASVDDSFGKLADQPGHGALVGSRHERLKTLRKWRVSGFANVLVFYEQRGSGVSVVRVLHAARDWWALLGVE